MSNKTEVYMNKQFFGVIILVIAALVGIFALTADKKSADGGGGNASPQASKHLAGAPTSKVNLTEYGDFQCPACKSYFPIINQLKIEYKDKVAFQFSHFPLVQIHPNAFVSSRAAEAAGNQGKFFEMHDLLYENQDTWAQSQSPNAIYESYAQQLGLDIEKFKTDVNSSTTTDVINADMKAGQAIKANSTPTFALNGKKIEKNPTSLDEFKKLLDDELAKNQ